MKTGVGEKIGGETREKGVKKQKQEGRWEQTTSGEFWRVTGWWHTLFQVRTGHGVAAMGAAGRGIGRRGDRTALLTSAGTRVSLM